MQKVNDKELKFILAPNSVISNANLEVISVLSDNLQIRILDYTGRIVWSIDYRVEKGVQKLFLETKLLVTGVYIIQIPGTHQQYQQQLIKQ